MKSQLSKWHDTPGNQWGLREHYLGQRNLPALNTSPWYQRHNYPEFMKKRLKIWNKHITPEILEATDFLSVFHQPRQTSSVILLTFIIHVDSWGQRIITRPTENQIMPRLRTDSKVWRNISDRSQLRVRKMTVKEMNPCRFFFFFPFLDDF